MARDGFIDEIMDFLPIMDRMNRWITQSSGLTEDFSLPPAQLRSLMVLKKCGIVNMTQLAESLMVPRQQMTKIIDSLVGKELVERRIDPNNRRSILIGLSPRGAELLNTLFYGENGVIDRFRMALGSDQRDNFIQAIRLFREALSSLEP